MNVCVYVCICIYIYICHCSCHVLSQVLLKFCDFNTVHIAHLYEPIRFDAVLEQLISPYCASVDEVPACFQCQCPKVGSAKMVFKTNGWKLGWRLFLFFACPKWRECCAKTIGCVLQNVGLDFECNSSQSTHAVRSFLCIVGIHCILLSREQ